MNKIIKNIVTLILILNIFASAIGINIHRHHCNSSNITMVSVFENHCTSHDVCSTHSDSQQAECNHCVIKYETSSCCVDDFERKSVDIKTVSFNSFELKPVLKIEFLKILPNHDDIDTENKFKQYHKLPKDAISYANKLIIFNTLKICSPSDDDLIS